MGTKRRRWRLSGHDLWLFLCYGLACLTSVAVGGCSTLGPRTVRSDRFNYNKAGADSSNQQFLLNIVRLRYGEPIYWLEIGSMLSQYTFVAGATVSGWDGVGIRRGSLVEPIAAGVVWRSTRPCTDEQVGYEPRLEGSTHGNVHSSPGRGMRQSGDEPDPVYDHHVPG